MKKKQGQPPAKEWTGWALYNWGNPWNVYRTRKQAIQEAERSVSEPWSKCRAYFRVEKVHVKPVL